MKLTIIGAGPGDPDLITVKGLRLLEEADVIVYADSLVNEQLIRKAKAAAQMIKTANLDLEEIVQVIVSNLQQGKKVVRVHTGDPSMYGAIHEQISLLKKANVEVDVIPGVSSVFAAAAAVQAELTIPDLTQTVILTRAEGRTPVPEKEQLRNLAQHHTTVALFLSALLTKKVVAQFLEAGWDGETPVVVVYRASWPDQKIIRTTLQQLVEVMGKEGINKQAMILAGWALSTNIHDSNYRSKLYDRYFSHGYRKGIED